jgi:ABC-type lipoprotein export system ATPase subunit
MALLHCENISKTYSSYGVDQEVLRNVSATFSHGDICVVLGPSGSGKTSLLSILGCLLSPTSGSITINGSSVDFSSPKQLLRIRREMLGFVFQQAQLLPFLNVEENIRVTCLQQNGGKQDSRDIVDDLMDSLGILPLRFKKPATISGGERQRVAIARALAGNPMILLADEPTASLDWRNGQAVIRLLLEQARKWGALLLTVTHDTRLVEMFERVFEINDGELVER